MEYTLDNDIAILRFDDGKANAVSHDFIDAMTTSLDQAEQEARAVVLLGRDGMFSGGFDLKEIAKGADEAAELVNRGAHMLHRLFNYPGPLVAGCTGHAIAAGAFMLLAADTRIGCLGDFRLGLNETAIGMVLPVFGFELASNRLSKRHQTAVIIQAALYSPEDAVDVGFLDRVVTAEALESACLETATQLAVYPTAAYTGQKRKLRADSLAAIKASLT